MRLSELIQDKDTETQRRIYSQFTRGVSRGEVAALKVLDKMRITKKDGTPREVQDFVIPDSTAEQLTQWFQQQATKPTTRRGITAEEAAKLPEAELMKMIEATRAKKTAPKKARKPRAKKTEKTSTGEPGSPPKSDL